MTLTLLLASGIGIYGSFFARPAPKPNVNPPVSWSQAPAQDAKRFPMKMIEPPACKR